ncbi:hypothetical protein LCGC14_0761790 [marine sediment metagenome]|uniref:Uncharacterized protein n=1 Tax=marine sediment metagenome TaxID=412755 RepID=A0A0F9Q4Z8_9ZZZZ|nr:hypothetical protein [bacterium]
MNKTKNLPYSESMNYWKTSRSSPDHWIEKTIKLIKKLSGRILMEAFGKDAAGNSAYMLAFEIQGDRFKIVWPVLPSKTGDESAARRQAATFLYHDTKAKCISATILGVRTVFFSHLLLPSGQVVSDLSPSDVLESIPSLFQPGQQLLSNGDVP